MALLLGRFLRNEFLFLLYFSFRYILHFVSVNDLGCRPTPFYFVRSTFFWSPKFFPSPFRPFPRMSKFPYGTFPSGLYPIYPFRYHVFVLFFIHFPIYYYSYHVFSYQYQVPSASPNAVCRTIALVAGERAKGFFPLFLRRPFPFKLTFSLLIRLVRKVFRRFKDFPMANEFSFNYFFFSKDLLFLPSFLYDVVPSRLFLPGVPTIYGYLRVYPFPS